MKTKRYRKAIPYCDGWWLWRENGESENARLLIVSDGKHAEVATDECFCRISKISYPPDQHERNYWEMTDCSSMGGLWMLGQLPPPEVGGL